MFDKIGDGSASYSWTIEGKREDGTPWELHKTNMYVSEFDLSFESAFEIYGELLAIANYPNEEIELTNTEATINLEETVRDYHIERLLWCHGGTCEKVRSLRASPGDTLKFRAILKPSDGSANQKVNFQFRIPNGAKNGAAVTVGGGSGCNPFFGGCGRTPDTFDDLLASFEGQPNNVLVAQLLTGRKGTVSAQPGHGLRPGDHRLRARSRSSSRVSAARRPGAAEATKAGSSSSRTLASRLRAAG